MSKKVVNDAWKVLRLSLREIALEYADQYSSRVNALPAHPAEPERIESLVKHLANELEALDTADQHSPVLRFFKKQFAPNHLEKTRDRLVKAFDSYLSAWQENTAPKK